ncbi:MAG: hypothetical protein AAGE93_21255 [Bacteroidota bacterium]
MGKPHPSPDRRPRGENFQLQIAEILQLDTQQQTDLAQLAQQHGQQMRAIDREQRTLLRPYFYNLIGSTDTVDTVAILQEVSQLERDKIKVTHQHFQDIKALLTEEQLPNFEKFINRALDILLLDTKGRPRPRGGGLDHDTPL